MRQETYRHRDNVEHPHHFPSTLNSKQQGSKSIQGHSSIFVVDGLYLDTECIVSTHTPSVLREGNQKIIGEWTRTTQRGLFPTCSKVGVVRKNMCSGTNRKINALPLLHTEVEKIDKTTHASEARVAFALWRMREIEKIFQTCEKMF